MHGASWLDPGGRRKASCSTRTRSIATQAQTSTGDAGSRLSDVSNVGDESDDSFATSSQSGEGRLAGNLE